MRYYSSAEHNGQNDEIGHLWERDRESIMTWRCARCGNRLHGVKNIFVIDEKVDCRDNNEERSALELHGWDDPGTNTWEDWEEWPKGADESIERWTKHTIGRLERRSCRLLEEVRSLTGRIKELEVYKYRQQNAWWLDTFKDGLWHATENRETWEKIKACGAIKVQRDGRYGNSKQARMGYVCCWDFRYEEKIGELDEASFLREKLQTGKVWMKIDEEVLEKLEHIDVTEWERRRMEQPAGYGNVIPEAETLIKGPIDIKYITDVYLMREEGKPPERIGN